MGDFHLRNLIGFPLDTTLAAAQLIFTGVLDRFRNSVFALVELVDLPSLLVVLMPATAPGQNVGNSSIVSQVNICADFITTQSYIRVGLRNF